jgi:cysteine desulfurase
MPIYLDHAATTPLRREALDAMLPLLTDDFGNASSAHSYGRRARAALDDARASIAANLGAEPREIIFTAGGTDAVNLALKGAAWAGKARGHRLLAGAADHHAVLHSLRHLEKFGFEAVILPVDRYGRVDAEQLDANLNDRTTVVSLMLANNEVGTIEAVRDLVVPIRAHRDVVIHLDAVQAAPYMALDVRDLDVDLVSIAAHKFEGPKGVGALYVRHGTILLPQTHGGSQERFRRAGTENVAGAAGMAVAFALSCAERNDVVPRLAAQRDRLREAVLAVGDAELTGHPRKRLPGHLSIICGDATGDALVRALDLEGIAVSTGSACTTGSTEPSHVLTALGYPDEEARGSLRLTIGRTTTDAEIETASRVIPDVIARIRAAASAAARDPLGVRVDA